MIDYNAEAASYDATRGGTARADSAAAAVANLVPFPGLLLDLGGGTGLIGERLRLRGHRVAVADLSQEMLRLAAARLPGCTMRMTAARLGLGNATFDTAIAIWLLHLTRNPEALIAEAARVLRPGGRFVTTVDKSAAQGIRRENASDALPRVITACQTQGLHRAGATSFVGEGQPGQPVYPLISFVKDWTDFDRHG